MSSFVSRVGFAARLSAGACRRASTLVLVDHNNATMSPVMLKTFNAAKSIGGPVTAIVLGHQADAVVAAVSKVPGVTKVLYGNSEQLKNFQPEAVSPVLEAAQKQFSFSHVIAPSSANGKSVLPRFAAKLDVAVISDITGVKSEDTFTRNIYAGAAVTVVKSKDSVKVLTVRGTAFDPITGDAGSAAVENVDASAAAQGKSEFAGQELVKSDRPVLETAKRVVAGGRGMKGKEHFDILFNLATELDAAVGASRAAVDAGYCAGDLQIGQTGKSIAPELYIGCGISGAAQHIAGMKDSKVIVVINKDPEAPFFELADYGLKADLFQAVPELTAALKK